MSTRGAFGFRLNGVDRVTYNHSDSYPTGLGVDIAKLISTLLAMPDLEEKVAALKMVESSAMPTAEQKETLAAYTRASSAPPEIVGHTGVGGALEQGSWYQVLRETQGDLMKTLECGYMIDSHDFLADSLFCEWAYIINLDDGTLEVYEGLQKNLHTKGRYGAAGAERIAGETLAKVDAPVYNPPVALIATFPLKEVTEKKVASLGK